MDTDLVPVEEEFVERRREMKSGQVRKTPFGDIKFVLAVDLPEAISEDDFKRYMGEYAAILHKVFPFEGTPQTNG